MAKTGRYLHGVDNPSAVAAIGTAYASGKRVTLKLVAKQAGAVPFRGFLESLSLWVSSISSVGTVTCKVTADAAGDTIIVPERTGTLDVGETTATDGSVAFNLSSQAWVDGDDTVYLWLKGDAGTFTLDTSRLIWSE